MPALFKPALWLSLSFAVMAGCSTSIASKSTDIDGATVYANQCGRCHEFRSPTEFNGPQWAIVTTHMRVVGGIPADESRAVYEFLKSQHHPPPAKTTVAGVPPATAAVSPLVGAQLLQERGCLGCHVVEGQGGAMGPALDGIGDRRSPEFVRSQLKDPKATNPASLMPNLGLSDSEIEAIWAYLQTLDGADGT